jgi:very-short-patch-repair endonuclease
MKEIITFRKYVERCQGFFLMLKIENPTPAEKLMLVVDNQLVVGYFKRNSILKYVADFTVTTKLVIEIDGVHHLRQQN